MAPTSGDASLVYLRLLDIATDSTAEQRKDAMLILADLIEEQEQDAQTAIAYRWAAEQGLWPFERASLHGGKDDPAVPKVFDWDGEHRKSINGTGKYGGTIVPDHARLPMELYDAMRHLPDRAYGEVHQAFVLLGRVLAGEGERT